MGILAWVVLKGQGDFQNIIWEASMMNLGMGEFLIILIIVVLLFGAKKIPALGQAMGSAILNFKKGLRGSGEQLDQTTRSKDS